MTKFSAIRRHPEYFVIAGVCAAVFAGAGLRIWMAPEEPVLSTDGSAALAESDKSIPFESPMVSLPAQLREARPSALLYSTSAPQRLSQIQAGRLDPFASVVQGGTLPPTASSRPSAAAAPTTEVANSDQMPSSSGTLPVVPVSGTVNLPPVPLATAPVTPESASLPVLPEGDRAPNRGQTAPQPLNPVQAIELTGVVQVGDRTSVILREPNASTSRHAFAGEYLANGQVLLKHIDLSSPEPLVILEYQGSEYSRIVSGAAVANL